MFELFSKKKPVISNVNSAIPVARFSKNALVVIPSEFVAEPAWPLMMPRKVVLPAVLLFAIINEDDVETSVESWRPDCLMYY